RSRVLPTPLARQHEPARDGGTGSSPGLAEQGRVRVEGGLPAEVGVENRRGALDLATSDEIDEPRHRLSLVDRVRDHALEASGEAHRVERGGVRDAVGSGMVSVVEDDLVLAQVAPDADGL